MKGKSIRWLRDLVTVDPGLKLLAVAIAVLADVAVHRDSVRDADVTVPVRIQGLAANQIYVGGRPENAKLRVRGRRVALAELKAVSNWTLDVNLTSYRDGERFAFDPRLVSQQLPVHAIEVVAVEPGSLDVRLDVVETRLLPVEAVLSGEAAPGFRVGARQVVFDPPTVQITGPQSRMRKLTAIRTEPIDLAMTDRDLKVQARLLSPDPHVRVQPEEVHALLQLEEQELSRTLVGQPVEVRGCPPDATCTLEPAEVNVKVEGLGRTVRAFVGQSPKNLVFAEVGGALGRADQTVRLQVRPVKGLSLQPSPAVAKFSVVREIGAADRAPAAKHAPAAPAKPATDP
jgi:hypothetical protein